MILWYYREIHLEKVNVMLCIFILLYRHMYINIYNICNKYVYINYLTIDYGQRYSIGLPNKNLANTTLKFYRKSEVESHLSASMRVAPSGVWRRAFVRSCVSLRNRGCSKLSVVPHIVRFRWHRNTMLFSMRSQRVENYHIISIYVCLIYFSLSRENIYTIIFFSISICH